MNIFLNDMFRCVFVQYLGLYWEVDERVLIHGKGEVDGEGLLTARGFG